MAAIRCSPASASEPAKATTSITSSSNPASTRRAAVKAQSAPRCMARWTNRPAPAPDMGAMQERITTTNKASITSIQAIYVPADDYTDPAPATTFAHLDATTNLDRAISEKGIYPAVNPLDSTSRMLSPLIVGEEHY